MPSFRELVDLLPSNDPELPVADLPGGISRPAARRSAYVEPTLTLVEGDPQSAQVMLIAAPAAVGKSAFAEAVAVDRGSLLWDIGEFAVGSGTFLGKLSESHGIPGLLSVTEELSAGRYGVVLDALDEGYSLARSENFEAFVSDLAKQVVQLDPPGPAVVACGRTDTVDLTSLLLAEAGLETCVMALDFFSVEAAREFVDIQLDGIGHAAHRRFRSAFEEARSSLFQHVEAAIGGGDEDGGMDAPSFLGYAPVLIALARYLTVENYQALAQELARGVPARTDGDEGLWAFLRGIVDDLLEREQPKLVDRLPAKVRDAIPADRLNRLYSADEQCGWLLARAAKSVPPVVDLPDAVLPAYEKSVNETLGEHPFIGAGPDGFASVVFRDYVLGQAMAINKGAEDAREVARTRGFRPSPLLVRFFVEFNNDGAEIHADDLDILYASVHAEELGDSRAGLTVAQAVEGLEVQLITARDELIELVIRDDDVRRLRLAGRLARADVSAADWTIVLGGAGSEMVVGPDVTIGCDCVIVSSPSLRIEARDADEAVTWQANRVEHEAGDFHLAGADRERFRIVVSDQPVYPWTGFISSDAIPVDPGDPDIADAVLELKQLSAWFKPGPVRGEGPALPLKIMEVLVARRRVSPEMYEYALETGLVTIEAKACLLHPQQFGMNIVDLRARTATPAVREFLAGYLQSRES
jgi:hypothetical protein